MTDLAEAHPVTPDTSTTPYPPPAVVLAAAILTVDIVIGALLVYGGSALVIGLSDADPTEANGQLFLVRVLTIAVALGLGLVVVKLYQRSRVALHLARVLAGFSAAFAAGMIVLTFPLSLTALPLLLNVAALILLLLPSVRAWARGTDPVGSRT